MASASFATYLSMASSSLCSKPITERSDILSPFESALYPLQTSPGGRHFLVGQLDVALWIPIFLASGPLWPIIFLPRHDKGELMSSLLIYVAGGAHLPTLLLLVVAQ
jgi:hypothetical protein